HTLARVGDGVRRPGPGLAQRAGTQRLRGFAHLLVTVGALLRRLGQFLGLEEEFAEAFLRQVKGLLDDERSRPGRTAEEERALQSFAQPAHELAEDARLGLGLLQQRRQVVLAGQLEVGAAGANVARAATATRKFK